MVIDKEEALDLLTARFESVNEIPRLSRAEKLAEYNRDRLPKGTFYHVQDKMGVSSYGLIVRLNEFRSEEHFFEFSVSENEPLYRRLDLDIPTIELRLKVQMLLDSMNRILLRPAG
ncbi:MAG: hypothetical protein DA405_05905 [Bacteroidetes bacterium]|nr:MAG: hypothetical protein DA405_05905 [Bacteroidota bacterium]